MPAMSMRERLTAIIRGLPIDRVPFVNYRGIVGTNDEVWALLGHENVGFLQWTSVHRLHTPNCRIEHEAFDAAGLPGHRYVLRTSAGSLMQEKTVEPGYGSQATRRHYVQTADDYRVVLAYLRDATVVPDFAQLERCLAELGDNGLPWVSSGRTPFQQLWVEWVSLTNLCCHMVDVPGLMEEVIAEMARVQREIFVVLRMACEKYSLPIVDIPDNLTAPMIGPEYFRRYCLPLYRELSAMLADLNVCVAIHADGDLRPLWRDIAQSGIGGLDSFSPPPDNDTSVAEALEQWPEMRLFVNFPSSVHLAKPEQVFRKAMEILEQGGGSGHLWIQISENVPQDVWRTSFPEIVRALREFGPPA